MNPLKPFELWSWELLVHEAFQSQGLLLFRFEEIEKLGRLDVVPGDGGLSGLPILKA